MAQYVFYAAIAASYVILFVIAHGLFRATSAFLMKKMPELAHFTDEEYLAKMLKLMFFINLLAAAVTWGMQASDTVRQGYLLRPEFGESEISHRLEAKIHPKDGKDRKESIDLTLSPREMTKREKKKWMDAAAKELPALVLGDQEASHVDADLKLPSSMKNDSVEVDWVIEKPDIIQADGHLSDQIPKKGVWVHLHAEIVFAEDENEVRDCEMDLHVFPRALSDAQREKQELIDAVNRKNPATKRKVVLPKKGRQGSLYWSETSGSQGAGLLFLGLVICAALCSHQNEEKKKAAQARLEALRLDYPHIIGKLVLYLGAGLSARNALAKMASEYEELMEQEGRKEKNFLKRLLQKKKREHWGYRELIRCSMDMKNGMTEMDAYGNFGKRCDIAEYKALANILVQNCRKGGRELLLLLNREADEAMEERRKHACRLGEEAGTKLLLPMVLMLVLVMGILMVPAIMNFQM